MFTIPKWVVYAELHGHRPRTLTPAPAAAAKPPRARCRNRNAPRMARDPLENSTGGGCDARRLNQFWRYHGKMIYLCKWDESWIMDEGEYLFPTCQVRVVRFYVSCLLPPPPHASCLLVVLPPPPASCRLLPPPAASCLVLLLFVVLVVLVVRVVLVQLRSAIHSVRCRTSTTTIHAQCSLPDLNHDHPRPVFPAGPQPQVSPPSVPCRTSTASIHAKCSLPDLNREYPRQKICHIECQKICQIEC